MSDSAAANSPGPRKTSSPAEPHAPHFTEEVEVAGHIIDSLILPKILDEIMLLGGRFTIAEIKIGQQRHDPSRARLQVEADSAAELQKILASISRHGATLVHDHDCVLVTADMDGAFPEGFYCTTNQETEVRLQDTWIPLELPEMDCGLRVDVERQTVETVPMSDVRLGDRIVIGHQGVRVAPQQRDRLQLDAFSFMNSTVSSEKPKGVTVREIAAEMRKAREGNGRILIVAGPAVVHTGSRDLLSKLIQAGFVNVLFAGNALATHDMEQSLFGTSLGVTMDQGRSTEGGHEHHLRTINRIRRLGGIRQAVEQGVIASGIMYECIKQQIPYVLCGSIRDDGPLPDVITDALESQRVMRQHVPGLTFCLMIATTLHSIAVGNLLPARVKVVCVDINPATVTKLGDRGTFQTIGLVTDVEPFLRVLTTELGL
jgi:lysine-ketoglutarate reductase/saccharopine dehydrogenase-like protein (TIGR00300 family)